MSFNASHFCGFPSYQRAGKLVSGKRKPWGSNEIKSSDWSALCCGWLGWKMLLCAVALRDLAVGALKAALFWGLSLLRCFGLLLLKIILHRFLLPLHAVTRILLLKLLWHADEQRTVLQDWNTCNALMWRRQSGFSVILEFLHRQVHFWRIPSCRKDDTGWSCF